MCHHRSVNNTIVCMTEHLRIVYSDSGSSFEDLLDKDRSVPMHVKNVQSLIIETSKVSKNLSVPIVKKVLKNVITLITYKNHQSFLRTKVHSVFHGQESISYLATKTWNMTLAEMKNLMTVSASKREVKKLKPVSYVNLIYMV